jgi:hypothetical protein
VFSLGIASSLCSRYRSCHTNPGPANDANLALNRIPDVNRVDLG